MINNHTRDLLRQVFGQEQVKKIEEAYENLDHNVLEWLNCVDAAYSAGFCNGKAEGFDEGWDAYATRYEE